MIDIALVGTGGMMPLPNRFLTSLLCRCNGNMLLIDCGEGTQVSLKTLGWGFKSINTICFTHYHADHISGLPGLLLTIGNSGRTEPLTLIGPPGLVSVVKGLTVIAQDIPFPLDYKEIAPADIPVNLLADEISVSILPVKHRTVCYGYSLSLKRIGKFDLERAKQLPIPVKYWSFLQKGQVVTHEGVTYTPDMVLGDERKGIKISYITDSRPTVKMADFVRDSDLFICEGLYGDYEKIDKVKEHGHMVFQEAAAIASDGAVKELWLTHFSPALVNPGEFIPEIRRIFPNVIAGKDRMSKTILFEEE